MHTYPQFVEIIFLVHLGDLGRQLFLREIENERAKLNKEEQITYNCVNFQFFRAERKKPNTEEKFARETNIKNWIILSIIIIF